MAIPPASGRPKKVLPNIINVLAAHAAAVKKGHKPFLDSAGNILPTGSHIDPKPMRHIMTPTGVVSQPIVVQPPYVGAALPVITVTPGNPVDMGTPINIPNPTLWTDGEGGDVRDSQQGFNRADCWLLADADAVGNTQPAGRVDLCQRISPTVYQTTFHRNGQQTNVLSDSSLSNGNARPNPVSNAIGTCIMEKAYAYFLYGSNKYSDLDYNFWGVPFQDWGYTISFIQVTDPNIAILVAAALAKGCPMSTGTNSAATSVVANHAYSIRNVTQTVSGVVMFDLRNPWGYDDALIPQAQAAKDISTICVATPGAPFQSLTGDYNKNGVRDFGDLLYEGQHFGDPGMGFPALLTVAQNFGN